MNNIIVSECKPSYRIPEKYILPPFKFLISIGENEIISWVIEYTSKYGKFTRKQIGTVLNCIKNDKELNDELPTINTGDDYKNLSSYGKWKIILYIACYRVMNDKELLITLHPISIARKHHKLKCIVEIYNPITGIIVNVDTIDVKDININKLLMFNDDHVYINSNTIKKICLDTNHRTIKIIKDTII